MPTTIVEFDYRMETVRSWMKIKDPKQRGDLVTWIVHQIAEHDVDAFLV